MSSLSIFPQPRSLGFSLVNWALLPIFKGNALGARLIFLGIVGKGNTRGAKTVSHENTRHTGEEILCGALIHSAVHNKVGMSRNPIWFKVFNFQDGIKSCISSPKGLSGVALAVFVPSTKAIWYTPNIAWEVLKMAIFLKASFDLRTEIKITQTTEHKLFL